MSAHVQKLFQLQLFFTTVAENKVTDTLVIFLFLNWVGQLLMVKSILVIKYKRIIFFCYACIVGFSCQSQLAELAHSKPEV